MSFIKFLHPTWNMGLFDVFKKKKEEKKVETLPSAGENPSESTPAESPGTASPESAEEIAEKIMILIPYIKQYRSQGMLDEEIVAFLTQHDWPESIVKRAVKNA